MPVPAVDADKRGDAYKKVKPVDGIDEQGLVPDPQVMHVAAVCTRSWQSSARSAYRQHGPLSTHLHL